MKNLYIAYAATWIIHLCYALYLWRKGAALQREVREFQREQQTSGRSQ
ncbi:MAG: CcmD family protein [Acidobacteria bacterium]|nr:CcmD family protein [Acidobacteriaceae bacterium]MBV9608954.1 CcmD family protein [Acidobacteriota bacterium]